MGFTFTNEINIFDLIAFVGFLGWVVGILSGLAGSNVNMPIASSPIL